MKLSDILIPCIFPNLPEIDYVQTFCNQLIEAKWHMDASVN